MAPDVGRAGQMLRVLGPVPIGDVVEAQRGLGRRQLCDEPRCLLSLGRLYFFGFTPRRAFRRAVKPMTSHLEVEVEIRRATVSVLIDGHGTSFRVWLAMKSSRSVSANMRRGRFVPWPMTTYRSAPEATWPLSVLIEQRSLRAASTGVRRPSGGGRDAFACRPSIVSIVATTSASCSCQGRDVSSTTLRIAAMSPADMALTQFSSNFA